MVRAIAWEVWWAGGIERRWGALGCFRSKSCFRAIRRRPTLQLRWQMARARAGRGSLVESTVRSPLFRAKTSNHQHQRHAAVSVVIIIIIIIIVIVIEVEGAVILWLVQLAKECTQPPFCSSLWGLCRFRGSEHWDFSLLV